MSIVITGTGSDGNAYNLTPLHNAALRVLLDPADQARNPNLWGNAFTFTRLPISPTQSADYVTGGHTAINYSSRTQENRSRPAGWSNLPNFQNLMPNNRIMVNGATRQFLSHNNIRNYPATGRCFIDSNNWREFYVGDLMPRTFPFTGLGWNGAQITVGSVVTDSRYLDVVSSQNQGNRQRTATLNNIWDSQMRAFNFLIVGPGGNGANQQSGTPKNSWTGGGGGGGGAWAFVYVRVKRGTAGNRQIRMQASNSDAWIDYADGTTRLAGISVNRGGNASGTSGGSGGGWQWLGSRTTGIGTRVFFEDDFIIIEALATGNGSSGSNGAQDGNAAGQTSITTSIPWAVPIGLLTSNVGTGTSSSGTQLPGNQEQGQGGLSFFRSRMTTTPTIQGGSVWSSGSPGVGGFGGGRITTTGREGERSYVGIVLN